MYKRLLIATFILLGLTFLLGALPIHGEQEVYENVVRLHVIANSDSEEDQALKLTVRDAVLDKTQDIFASCKTKEEAELVLSQNLATIEKIAQETIIAAGYDYNVSVAIGEENYPTKSYESCCFPSGEYTSLRIMIGGADGQNWWCVLFPPMCVGVASNAEESFAQVGLTGDQYNIITQTDKPKYKARFKILEAIEGVMN